MNDVSTPEPLPVAGPAVGGELRLDLLGNAWYNLAYTNKVVTLAKMPKSKKPSPLSRLSEKEIQQLRQIDERLRRVVQERRAGMSKPGVHAEQSFGLLTLRYETVRCGKANCTRCPHGPYWYAYWKEDGRTRSRYVGRSLPDRAKEAYEEKRKAKLNKR